MRLRNLLNDGFGRGSDHDYRYAPSQFRAQVLWRRDCGIGWILGQPFADIEIGLTGLAERNAAAMVYNDFFPTGAFGVIAIFVCEFAALCVNMGAGGIRKIGRLPAPSAMTALTDSIFG